jgi:hypothetical protein
MPIFVSEFINTKIPYKNISKNEETPSTDEYIS